MDYPFNRRLGTFVTAAGTRIYIPSASAIVIRNIRIPSASAYLGKTSVEQMDQDNPGYDVATSYGPPEKWYPETWAGVKAQPSAAAAIYCVSDGTEAADVTITIDGVVNGEEDREVVTLAAGATPNATTTKQFTQIYAVSKGAVSDGVITIKQTDASGTELATLGRFRRSIRYITIGLQPIPDGVYTCYFKMTPWAPEMINDSDVPLVPETDTQAIVDAGMLCAAEHHGDRDLLASREARYLESIERIRERVKDDAPTVPQFRFATSTGQYPIVAGDYSSYLRHLYWA